MIRFRVGFSHGGYVIVNAYTPEEARSICLPMVDLDAGEFIEYIEPQNLPALLKRQAE